MNPKAWAELVALAERYCPDALADFGHLTGDDALALLRRLRQLDAGAHQ